MISHYFKKRSVFLSILFSFAGILVIVLVFTSKYRIIILENDEIIEISKKEQYTENTSFSAKESGDPQMKSHRPQDVQEENIPTGKSNNDHRERNENTAGIERGPLDIFGGNKTETPKDNAKMRTTLVYNKWKIIVAEFATKEQFIYILSEHRIRYLSEIYGQDIMRDLDGLKKEFANELGNAWNDISSFTKRYEELKEESLLGSNPNYKNIFSSINIYYVRIIMNSSKTWRGDIIGNVHKRYIGNISDEKEIEGIKRKHRELPRRFRDDIFNSVDILKGE